MSIEQKHTKAYLLFMWLIPSFLEFFIYLFLTLVSIFLSSQEFITKSLFIKGDFNPIRAGIGSIDVLLENLIGEKIAGSISLAIFWGLVGLSVNVLWWLGSNFSTELNNDLVFSKYVHPRDTNPTSQLREFITKTVFRTSVAFILIFYANYFLSYILPNLSYNYQTIFSRWSDKKNILALLITIAIQVFCLHIFTILTRFVLLKKQVFGA